MFRSGEEYELTRGTVSSLKKNVVSKRFKPATAEFNMNTLLRETIDNVSQQYLTVREVADKPRRLPHSAVVKKNGS
jgi:hypothetical protein